MPFPEFEFSSSIPGPALPCPPSRSVPRVRSLLLIAWLALPSGASPSSA